MTSNTIINNLMNRVINILYIGASDFVYTRGINGSSHELDFLAYLNNYTNQMDGYTSDLIFSHQLSSYNINTFNPSIIYLFDCDKARSHFNIAINYANTNKIPIVLLSNDLFHYDLVATDYNTPKLDGIVCTVRMDRLMNQYRTNFPTKFISSIPVPFVNTNQFNNWNMNKIYDICIFGQLDLKLPPIMNCVDEDYFQEYKELPETHYFYPLRRRLAMLILSNTHRFRVKHIPTPQASCWNCPIKGKELSKIINQSYISISTRSRSDRCMQKYFEISASNAMILGDIPTDYRDLFEGHVIEVSEKMSDEEILDTIDTYLQDKKKLEQEINEFGEFIRREYGLSNKNTITGFLGMTNDILKQCYNKAYISNTCSNIGLYNGPYNHPFIGSLFVNDEQYIQFCQHFDEYIRITPTFGEPNTQSVWAQQNGNQGWYKHPSIHPPYPVMYLGDIEIHWIHETECNSLLTKYNRRLQRYYTTNATPVFLLSCSELLNDHSDHGWTLSRQFLNIPNSIYIQRFQHTEKYPNEIMYEPWIHTGFERDVSHVYTFNNQDTIVTILKSHLNILK